MFKLILMVSCLMPFAASADTFFVKKDKGNSEASAALQSLIKSEVAGNGHTVTKNAGSAQWVLTPKALKLGSAYIITLTKSQNGQVVFSDKLKTTNLDDLDIVTERLVSGVIKNKKASGNQSVDTVTENEVKGTTVKAKVTRQYYVGFGPSKVANLDTENSGVMVTGGMLWGLDHQFSLRAGVTLNNISSSHADMTNVGIGGQYYFNRQKHAPYVVGLLGYSWAESDIVDPNSSLFDSGIDESGWGAEIGGGMHFFRTTTVNLAVELTYNHGFYTVTDGNPGSYGAKLIILW